MLDKRNEMYLVCIQLPTAKQQIKHTGNKVYYLYTEHIFFE